jgi:glycosyltransferase involved in cell wall biosynthesis
MEIVFLVPHFPPDFQGGTETVTRSLARELVALGHRVRVVAGTDRPHTGADVERARAGAIEVAFVPRKPDEYYDLDLERPRLRPLVRELVRGADVVHVHNWWTLHARLVRDARAAGLAVVVTFHDLFTTCPRFFRVPPDEAIRCPPPREYDACARCVAPETTWSHAELLAGFARREAWIAAELADVQAFVTPSRAHADKLAEYVSLDPARLSVIAHGLPEPLPRVVQRGWDGRGPLRVLFLGHRSDVKGVRDLVGAVANLAPEERARVELVLLGSEVVTGYDDELRRAGAGVRLVFAGTYTHADLAARLAALGGAHLGAFPSRAFESYGLVPDELMALGLPVWVGDRGAPRERVGRAGRVLPSEDPPAWTRALASVLEDPAELERERAALPPHARTTADAARELDALYARVVGTSGNAFRR